MASEDITFCANAKCGKRKCERHQRNISGTKPYYSFADLEGTEYCIKKTAKKAKLEPRKCVVCGTVFQPKRDEHICCSEKCRAKRRNEMNRLWDKKHRVHRKKENKKEKPLTNHEQIAQDTIKAKELGFPSYGQYKSYLYMQELKKQRKERWGRD